MIRRLAPLFITICLVAPALADDASGKIVTLPGTRPLTMEGDIASHLVEGVDRFLLQQIEQSGEQRASYWNRDVSSPEAYNKSIEPNRKRLAHILGVRDPRVPFDAPELVATTEQPALVGQGDGFEVYAVRWPVLAVPGPTWPQSVSIHGEGLLLVPTRDKEPRSPKETGVLVDVIAIPDADQTPEQIAGLTEGVPPESQFARRLAEGGCRVLVPTLISRHMEKRNGRANLTNREYLYRSAFVLGRHLIGYEVQKVLAGVDWLTQSRGTGVSPVSHRRDAGATADDAKIAVIGYGEGGMIALYAAALDTRIDAAVVSGYFGPRETIWKQPISRNVFGLLREFGDAELASMIAPRQLIVDAHGAPELTLPGEGGAPAELSRPDPKQVRAEFERLDSLNGKFGSCSLYLSEPGTAPFCRTGLFTEVAAHLVSPDAGLRFADAPATDPPKHLRKDFDPSIRQQRQVDEIDRHNQWLLRESSYVRKEFMKDLDTSSLDAYRKSVEPYREIFREQVIGRFDIEPLPFNARTRKTWETDKWTGYEVVLDVWPIDQQPGSSEEPGGSTVIAYGVLLLPKDIKKGEKRPVVVCQHGLEGRPTDTFLDDHPAYHDFAAKLAERGFITFAPQNLYIFKDRFRTLQRKANPLGKTLFSVIVPQHQQMTDWLQTLPQVDPERIAFYGLSYGGKSAMRIPPLVSDYCLSICSADFNEWVDKNASTRGPYSYVWTGEYEIFEFDLGSTFNYAEMAALICPRPFMVERGHFDGVGTDENVAHEFAKVRHLYQAKLGIGDRCEIEWFVGPHTINGQGTFEFLHEHLDWPRR